MQSQQESTTAGGVIIEVSTTFFPTAILPGTNERPNMILFSSDAVFFYCHRSTLSSKSYNSFGNLISSSSPGSPTSNTDSNGSEFGSLPASLPTHALPEPAVVLNVMLHVIYNLPVRRFAPSLHIIEDALRILERYGIPAPDESADIWFLLLRHAEIQPIRAYAIAAGYAKEAVCVRISPYTLRVSLTQVSDAEALTMGSIYLRRLFFLHLGRAQACKRVIDKPPKAHPPMALCLPEDASRVARAWDLAVANILVHPSLHNISPEELRESFSSVVRGRMCSECFDSVRVRVNEVVADWEGIKKTI
ncbi:hypothetical protein FRB96_007219 [Tulasnella sp. 330]|nr:hypothetical protein FRB96_007219 [Tulasnella sp. 330]KAG8876118.1 hypothetical protein FRB97_004438 [Tulasnella sp. 331]